MIHYIKTFALFFLLDLVVAIFCVGLPSRSQDDPSRRVAVSSLPENPTHITNHSCITYPTEHEVFDVQTRKLTEMLLVEDTGVVKYDDGTKDVRIKVFRADRELTADNTYESIVNEATRACVAWTAAVRREVAEARRSKGSAVKH